MPRAFFFGVASPRDLGHFMYQPTGEPGGLQRVWDEVTDKLPFRYQICDGGLLPQRTAETQGFFYRSVINGWTLISCFDRTGDKRPASCSTFIAEGEYSMEDMRKIAESAFPSIWKRIHGTA